ncbi:alpha/beta hydrolase [Amycolatopsis sp.]|uniref:alpha/beta fold hydrolase n=1 Tax=Amycolatopsis sp. TaxID=37632 RepID=UPI002E0B5E31|nr:alpha/beta hydrolase [Amycolatopsis sp.]
MPTFSAPDGTELAYRELGSGAPVICLPGGPMMAGEYLGDLGGLDAHRQLVLLDLRGTGDSAEPKDTASYRCDQQVDDVEALREHLGLDQIDLLGHSAGASLAIGYAVRYPARVGKLVLVTPSTRSIGLEVPGEVRREILDLRKDEPWFATASAAYESIAAGTGTGEDWAAVAPMAYGRWDAAAEAHQAAEDGRRNDVGAPIFNSEGAFDPPRVRAALATFTAPVLLTAGEIDWITSPGAAAEFAGLFPNAELFVQVGVSHHPWLDDPANFVAAVAKFLA